jgi:tRNA(Ile)-lysidine synthase TilS/MesJ
MKCRVCRGPAVIDVRRHNANFCPDHFLRYCHQQVERAIDSHAMCRPDERLLVAVSGGKDSLALWDILLDLGYRADGLYLGLGIDGYSDASLAHTREFARSKQATLVEVDLNRDFGCTIPAAADKTGRVPCSACGLSKRHLIDRVAVDRGYDAVATGHNLDDEAAVLFGNVLRWQVDYLRRQLPVLPEGHGFPRKIKPLIRLGERETAAYCVLRGIDYQLEECPMAAGNKHLVYKQALNEIELESPGAKTAFYFEFLRRAAPLLAAGDDQLDDGGPSGASGGDVIGRCRDCGGPTDHDVCAFCRLVDRVGVHEH